MLKEKIFYKYDLPVNVVTARIDEYPIHFHEDIEVVYVLDGSVVFRNGYYTYTLKRGDIFIVNDREMHSFAKTSEDNMVMMLQLDLTYFSRYYDSLKNCFFVTDSDDESDESLDILKEILARIMMEILHKGYGYEHKVIESTHNLIANLIANFQYFVMEDGRFKNETRNKGNKILAGRLNRITDYMYDNYNRKLTLGEIADNEHLSIYYLSHIIKEATGLSFQDLLNYIRVEQSERILLGSNKKIGAIAEETGFSAVRYYIKHFRTWFGMHPAEYREKYKDKVFRRDIDARYDLCPPREIEEAIRYQVRGAYADYISEIVSKPVIVDIDAYEKSNEDPGEKCDLEEIMANPANEVLTLTYGRLTSMNENVIKEGSNYMVTTGCKYPGPLDSLSILVYNFDKTLVESLKNISSQKELLTIADSYDERNELLIRSNGFDGKYRILRWRMDSSTIRGMIERAIDPVGDDDPRRALIEELEIEPSLSTEIVTCSSALSIRSSMSGLATELILIDRIDSK